jgi:NAD(P)-dependent dehydrogenase (short-subunit alcohol dehydrogenase family)
LTLLELGKQKKIINISTTLGSLTMAPRFSIFPVPAYKIAKAALNMLTVQYAQEYASKDFVIFALSPGVSVCRQLGDVTTPQMLIVIHSG